MAAKAGWWRRRRPQAVLLLLALLLVVYLLLQQDMLLDHDLTRRPTEAISVTRGLSVVEAKLTKYSAPKTAELLPVTRTKAAKSESGTKRLRDDVKTYVEKSIREALKEDKGTGCDIPKLNPFAPEITAFDKTYDPISCDRTKDWVRCKFDKCRVLYAPTRIEDVTCSYRDIVYVNDFKHHFADPVVVHGDGVYQLRQSDFAEVSCEVTGGGSFSWVGLVAGFRSVQTKKPLPGRESTYNILILGYDSTSKNGFIRRMPQSYKALEELGAVTLNGYNIVGDGTPAALFPILTGLTELELPEVRRRVGSKGHLDAFPFLWYLLSEDGYRTAYYEDSPNVGTFQYRFTGFERQPTDHYLRHFFLTYSEHYKQYNIAKNAYCVGDTPSFALMLNLTREFMHIDDGKKFIFNFIADITHDDFNFISNADLKTVEWLRSLKGDGTLDNTVLLVMGDHGPRYASVRSTLQGKLEERLPLMSFVLPPSFIENRREAYDNLKHNADILTTPFDIYPTLLDAVGLLGGKKSMKIVGSDLERSISLFTKVPSNRSCSEAGIEPHWCTCLKWNPLPETDGMYQPAAMALVDFINKLTEDERAKCAPRTLTSIEWVMSRKANPRLLTFKNNKDADGYVGQFDATTKITKEYYSVKVAVGPAVGMYEASMMYDVKARIFIITKRDISRINAYNNEPECVSATRPDLNMYCYCRDKTS